MSQNGFQRNFICKKMTIYYRITFQALSIIEADDLLYFLYARLKNGTYFVTGYGIHPSVNFFVSG